MRFIGFKMSSGKACTITYGLYWQTSQGELSRLSLTLWKKRVR